MDISAGLMTKGAAGALAATAAVGTGVAANNGLLDGIFWEKAEPKAENKDLPEQSVTRSDNVLEGGREPKVTSETEIVDGGKGTASDLLESADEHSDDEDLQDEEEAVDGVPDASQKQEKNKKITKFDQGLIDFLKANGDIIFDVKRGSEDLVGDDLTIGDSNGLPLTAKISVFIDKDETKLIETKSKGSNKEKGKRLTLQKLNGNENDDGTPWTWSCEVVFASEETNLTGKSIHNKDKIFSSSENGLFNLLKKDLSTAGSDPDKKEIKNAKEKIVRVCANARDNTNIKDQETLSDNKLEASIKINLKAGVENDPDNQTNTNMLYPEKEKGSKRIFERLFDKTTAQ